ncbi:succinylglutamate desuccinylase/aspartoacylase domain-containing protein [Nisaea sp.]|uniref:succinylglutamate desuccinylase/aspartoacylase domain-containing protein n=1 Tax=Nisaea sp. TaxID=2024842 RepID=UPI002B27103B|nr:succinylglutamate desuccinylase/aspartoacylase family protein [Nisaea sp.]
MSDIVRATAPIHYPVEIEAPDISAYRDGNRGVSFFTTFDSGIPGPKVLITALVHGNELCGAIALDHLFQNDVRPRVGSLTLGFCNVAANAEFRADYPAFSRFIDEDFNRVWDLDILDSDTHSLERARAREIRPIVDEADFLLDIHSMQNATEPLVLAGRHEKGPLLAERVGAPGLIVQDAGHASGRRMRDYSFFNDPGDPRSSLLVECGQHWSRAAADVAVDVTYRFLHAMDMIDDDLLERHAGLPTAPAQTVIEITDAITVTTDSFLFHDDYVGMEIIPRAGTEIGLDGDKPIRTPHDNCVLVMPSRRLSLGLTAVRLGRFVE